jgi:peptide chain release factor 3
MALPEAEADIASEWSHDPGAHDPDGARARPQQAARVAVVRGRPLSLALPRAGRSTLAAEVSARRTFAIISHPDAGKTTLTEKFLLFAGAIEEAGSVKARRRARSTTSDWMELERARGISVSSTVLRFEHADWVFNLLDTPGHADFSEDTYRTLWAADAAIVVIDRAKGIEEQTRKLLHVCRARGVPIVTFVNKCDRPGRAPLELLDDIEAEFGVEPVPLTWPVSDGIAYAGIVDRRRGEVVDVQRTAHGAGMGEERVLPLGAAPPGCPAVDWQVARDELELLDHAGGSLDPTAVLAGRQTPVFFGSALTNLGVHRLLEGFAELAPAPRPLAHDPACPPRAVDDDFSGFVFKVQANTDPRHRDRIAFLRLTSGRFRRGMSVTNARTGRPITLRFAHELFGRERTTLDDAVAGDVVGIVNATGVLVGDTLYEGQAVAFPPIPTFAPERFVTVRSLDSSRYKRFRAGLVQLDEEGVVHVMRRPSRGDQEPILAAVGQLQLDVARYRLESEFGCPVLMQPGPWVGARRVVGTGQGIGGYGVDLVEDSHGRPLALFRSETILARVLKEAGPGALEPVGMDARDPLAGLAA